MVPRIQFYLLLLLGVVATRKRTLAQTLPYPTFTKTADCSAGNILGVAQADLEECLSICQGLGGCLAFDLEGQGRNKCRLQSEQTPRTPCTGGGYVRANCNWLALPNGRFGCLSWEIVSIEMQEEYRENYGETKFTELKNGIDIGSCEGDGVQFASEGPHSLATLNQCKGFCLEDLACVGVDWKLTQVNLLGDCRIVYGSISSIDTISNQGRSCHALSRDDEFKSCLEIATENALCSDVVSFSYQVSQLSEQGANLSCRCLAQEKDCQVQSYFSTDSRNFVFRDCRNVPTEAPTSEPELGNTLSPTISETIANSTTQLQGTEGPDVMEILLPVVAGSCALVLVTASVIVRRRKLGVIGTKHISHDLKGMGSPDDSFGRNMKLTGKTKSMELFVLEEGNARNVETKNPVRKKHTGNTKKGNPGEAAKKQLKKNKKPANIISSIPENQRISVFDKGTLFKFLREVEPTTKASELKSRADKLAARYSKANVARALQKKYNRVPETLVEQLANEVALNNDLLEGDGRISQLI